MGYMHIQNLYKSQEILLLKRCFALEKIHGTSANLLWDQDKLHFHSGGASYEQFKSLFDAEELTQKFTKSVVAQKTYVYGEAYGGKCQAMSDTYGKALKFIVFDVKINELWLSVPQAADFAKTLSLEFVHYNEVSTDLEEINRERDADSQQAIRNGMGTGKKREGVVLRPLIELRMNNDERLIVKHKGDEFRETATPRPVINPDKLAVLTEATRIAEEWVTPGRLQHIMGRGDIKVIPENTPQIIKLMLGDVLREGESEFVNTQEVRKAIGKETAKLWHQTCKNTLGN